MRTRFLAISLTLLTASAQASFELLLVADNGSNTFGTRAVHRFDPVSGAYMGKFGGFNADISSTHLDQATNSLYVITATETSRWNYNTGEYMSSHSYFSSTTLSAVRPSGDRAAYFSGTTFAEIYGFPTNGTPVATPSVSGAAFRTGIWTSDTTLIAFDTSQSRMVNFNFNAAGTVATVGVVSNPVAAATGYGQMCFNGGLNQVIVVGGTQGFARAYTPGSATVSTIAIPGGNALSAATAHAGFFVGVDQLGSGRIDAYSQYGNVIRQFGQGVVFKPVSMQTVLAPEPGSLAVLGLGLVALLKRRKI